VLAPMLMMGAAVGALEGKIFPDFGPGFWAIVGMAAILGGTMRVPFTAIFFTIELTQDVGMLLPLLVATVTAYGLTVLLMPRSILTEKVSRRGFHITREYSVDPLDVLSVQEVMRTSIVVLPLTLTAPELERIAAGSDNARGQHLYPILDADDQMVSVVTRRELRSLLQDPAIRDAPYPLQAMARAEPVLAYPAETLRMLAARMAETGLTAFPVVERAHPGQLLGIVGLRDMLRARERQMADERDRQRYLRIRFFRGGSESSSPQAEYAD